MRRLRDYWDIAWILAIGGLFIAAFLFLALWCWITNKDLDWPVEEAYYD